MPEPTHAKPRASRIPLDYFRREDHWTRWKGRLSLVAVLAGLGMVAWGLASPEARRMAMSRGRVAGPHSAWNNDCAACHQEDFQFSGEARLDPLGNPCAGGRMDQRCNACHNGGFPLQGGSSTAWVGAFHHANASPESTASCAGCHHEHRGEHANLTRVPDSACVNCHAGLDAHAINPQAVKVGKDIRGFGQGAHPPFRPQAEKWKDPGSVKFNHALHMKPGMGQNYALSQVATGEREKYKAYASDQKELVSLDCAACHHLDSTAAPGAPARQPGQVFLPVSFDRDCKACHELAFTRDPDGTRIEVPHKVQPAELKAFVEAVYARQFLAEQGAAGKAPGKDPGPPLPGKALAAGQAPPDQKEFEKAYGTRVKGALTRLFSKAVCAECHHLEGQRIDDHAAGFGTRPLAEMLSARIQTGFFRGGESKPAADWLGDQGSPIPVVWQPRARFNHAAHRAWDCVSCHAAASGSTQAADILIPAVENCQSCHGPAGGGVSATGPAIAGGARRDCAGCHSYHQGPGPLAGVGSRAWAEPRGADSSRSGGGGAR